MRLRNIIINTNTLQCMENKNTPVKWYKSNLFNITWTTILTVTLEQTFTRLDLQKILEVLQTLLINL